MHKAFEKLWNEYFAEKCAAIHTNEERTLIKKAAEMQKAANKLLTKEQSEVAQKYIEALHELHGLFVKKAFFEGCEFAMSFFFEVWNGWKT